MMEVAAEDLAYEGGRFVVREPRLRRWLGQGRENGVCGVTSCRREWSPAWTKPVLTIP